MKIFNLIQIFLLTCLVLAENSDLNRIQFSFANEKINLAVVACGDRSKETLVLLKSALMFTSRNLEFIIITERKLKNYFVKEFQKWPQLIQKKFNYTLMEPSFPKENEHEWRNLFKMCASQRIFLPSVLKKIDSILYVDTDVLFISDIADVWDHFDKFNSSQLAALAPEHEEPTMGWYNRFATHPYYGKLGLNSGVMLMNLTRMREFEFVKKILPLYKQYKNNIPWGDQCLLNILFHFYPDKLYVYDCEWNYRPDHCMYGSNCKTAEIHGARVLHGCRRCFHNDKQPAFKAIYQVIDWYEFGKSERNQLFRKLEKMYEKEVISSSYCGKAYMNIFKTLKNSFELHKKMFENITINDKIEL